ncbi:MAG: CPBP family intramembrane metalloprotease [Candidatus Methanoperedens sp.]|nr:CPBP family intramembrane metalloprotease [Candidatus Methanoperedens sp.]CAG0948617.1 hypothetical protein METP1_00042 [Methanosarcinales archaeon]
MKPLMQQSSTSTTGYLILSSLFIVILTLMFKDPLYIVFGIPIIMVFALAASVGGKGSSDEDLAAIGWSNKHMDTVIPIGILGGIVAVFLAGLITSFTQQSAAIVPDFSSSATILSASVITPSIAMSVNIISQWLVVAPSEEAGYRILAPYAANSIFKNLGFAWIFATLLWVATHIPTFIAQGVPNSMYLVLIMIATITIGLLWYTGNIMSTIIVHGVYNTGVLLLSNKVDSLTFYIVAIIIMILFIAYYSSSKKGSRTGART